MLQVIDRNGRTVNIDTQKLDDVLPIELYNEDENGYQIEFDPVNDPDRAIFCINNEDGSTVEGLWEQQTESTKYDLSQLDDPM